MQIRRRSGMALVEILLALGVAMLLLAVALPNYQRSQIRSKVSSVRANLRDLAVALEAYHLENHAYPIVTSPPFDHPERRAFQTNELFKVYPGATLTSPIAYLADRRSLADDFRLAHTFDSPLAYEMMYLPSAYYLPPYPAASSASYQAQTRRYGLFVLRSAGPDGYLMNHSGVEGDYDAGGWNLASYDPTNGTLSAGDIYRSQISPDESHY